MDISLVFQYTEDVIPPRCRKPRRQRFDGSIDLQIPEVSADEAPVAIVAERFDGSVVNYRFYSDCLWKLAKRGISGDDCVIDRAYFAVHCDYLVQREAGGGAYCTQAEMVARLEEGAGKFLFIDDLLYIESGEPRYVVRTFGFGYNHGGTALMDDEYFNSNIREEYYFNLLQKDVAINYATAIAKERGDTKNLPIVPHTAFTVLLPQAIKIPARADI